MKRSAAEQCGESRLGQGSSDDVEKPVLSEVKSRVRDRRSDRDDDGAATSVGEPDAGSEGCCGCAVSRGERSR